MKGHKSLISIAAIASMGLAGAAYGMLAPPTFLTTEQSKMTVIEPYGQDVNGDGIATTAEGDFDIDGDGRFGEAERIHHGLGVFINWAYPEDLDHDPTFTRITHCASACTSSGGGFSCNPNLDTVMCIEIVGAFCYTTACAYPCTCPIP